ncbi:hypothetical protein ACVILK_001445 [Bradyrhizobium embrapense]
MSLLSHTRRSQITKTILWVAFALFVLSLFLPAASNEQVYRLDRVCQNPQWDHGLAFLLVGPFGVLFGQFGWFANPLMLLAAITRREFGLVFATLAILATTSTTRTLTHFWRDGEPDDVVCGFGPGYYAWAACSVLVLIAVLVKPPQRTSSETAIADS